MYKNVKKTQYHDSILIYMPTRFGTMKLYALHRYRGQKWSGEIIWRYKIMPIPDQPFEGFTNKQQIYDHVNKVFRGQKEIFDQWAASFPKDGRIVTIQRLAAGYVYQWD